MNIVLCILYKLYELIFFNVGAKKMKKIYVILKIYNSILKIYYTCIILIIFKIYNTCYFKNIIYFFYIMYQQFTLNFIINNLQHNENNYNNGTYLNINEDIADYKYKYIKNNESSFFTNNRRQRMKTSNVQHIFLMSNYPLPMTDYRNKITKYTENGNDVVFTCRGFWYENDIYMFNDLIKICKSYYGSEIFDINNDIQLYESRSNIIPLYP